MNVRDTYIEDIRFEEINFENWLNDTFYISVFVLTYNHLKTIKQCLDSILAQKTQYKYKIVIYDDCSTDGTTDIVKEYCEKHSDKIHALIAKENTYVLGKKRGIIFNKFRAEYITGKYFAICEGDDYWNSMEKIEKQITFLENNPEFSLTTHASIWENQKNGKSEKKGFERTRNLTIDDLMLNDYMLATASLIGKTEIYKDIADLTMYGVGDWPIKLWATSKGKVYYFDEVMSVYRYMAEGSWTATTYSDLTIRVNHITNMFSFLNLFNSKMGGKYSTIISKKKSLLLESIYPLFEKDAEEFEKFIELFEKKYNKHEDVILLKNIYVSVNDKKRTCENLKNILNKKIIIFGASEAGRRVLRILKLMDIEVIGFTDNDSSKWNKEYLGLNVYPTSWVFNQKDLMIQIASCTYDDEITEQICENSAIEFYTAKELYMNYFKYEGAV